MKIFSKVTARVTRIVFSLAPLAVSVISFAQKGSAIVDLKLGRIELTDLAGNPVNVNDLYLDQVVKLKLPVSNISHGAVLPVGSCKIKIGFGSKMILDPAFNLNDASVNSSFKWTATNTGGQLQVTGELIASLSPNVQDIMLYLKLKGNRPGSSTITANFLVTNHNTSTIVSDENGSNNASHLTYTISEKVAPALNSSDLELSIYPNPVSSGKDLTVVATKGIFDGKYKITMLDVAGRVTQSRDVILENVTNLKYSIGNVAAGKYFIRINSADGSKNFVLKFEKI